MPTQPIAIAGARARPQGVAGAVGDYLALTKPSQTALLLATGLCAYLISLPGAVDAGQLTAGMVSLIFAISGCTALNMVLDRDMDARMERTRSRPLPQGRLSVRQAATFGSALAAVGLALAAWQSILFALIIAAGLAIDLVVYTLWLKRRTPLSIAIGGVSGGMPALAARALVLGRVDALGLLLATAVLLWIPSHILTLATRHAADYQAAGIPCWPNRFGLRPTRYFVAVATVLNAAALFAAAIMLSVVGAALYALGGMALVLFSLAVACIVRPSDTHTFVLFKAASLYMLLSFVTLTFGAIH